MITGFQFFVQESIGVDLRLDVGIVELHNFVDNVYAGNVFRVETLGQIGIGGQQPLFMDPLGNFAGPADIIGGGVQLLPHIIIIHMEIQILFLFQFHNSSCHIFSPLYCNLGAICYSCII